MDLERRHGLTVAELIDLLSDHPDDAIVELAIVAPVPDDDPDDETDIIVDRYHIDGVMPMGEHGDDDSEDGDNEDGDMVVWLIGGESDDVETFIDALEQPGA